MSSLLFLLATAAVHAQSLPPSAAEDDPWLDDDEGEETVAEGLSYGERRVAETRSALAPHLEPRTKDDGLRSQELARHHVQQLLGEGFMDAGDELWSWFVSSVKPTKHMLRTDRDGDGLADYADWCVSSPRNDLPSSGCSVAAADSDGDGVVDSHDLCPMAPEDRDGVEDGDGCPEDAVAAAPPPAPAPAPAALPDIGARYVGATAHPEDAAIAIGLEDYFRIPDVPYARADAEAFATWATYTHKIPSDRVEQVTSGGREYLLAAADRAGERVGPNGTVYLYFSGHGAAHPETGDRLLLGDDVAPDATGFAARGVTVKELAERASAGGGKVLLLLDTCYAGTGRGGEQLAAGLRFAVPAYVRHAPKVAEWTAAQPSELSGPLDEAEHGAFTYFALGALRGWADGELGARDGKVTAEEANLYVQRALRAHGVLQQRPVFTSDGAASDWVLAEGVDEVGPAL